MRFLYYFRTESKLYNHRHNCIVLDPFVMRQIAHPGMVRMALCLAAQTPYTYAPGDLEDDQFGTLSDGEAAV